jgi:hypothetical protein
LDSCAKAESALAVEFNRQSNVPPCRDELMAEKYTTALKAGYLDGTVVPMSRSHWAFAPGVPSWAPVSPAMSGFPRPAAHE